MHVQIHLSVRNTLRCNPEIVDVGRPAGSSIALLASVRRKYSYTLPDGSNKLTDRSDYANPPRTSASQSPG